jgi:hypothetical protein
MAAVQHKDIPEAHLHETKGVATAAAKASLMAKGDGTGEWRKIRDDDFDYTNKANNKYGWADIADSLYTSAAPLSVASGVRAVIPNNALLARTDSSRFPGIWNPATNSFSFADLNSFYNIRIDFKVKAAAVGAFNVDVEIESASGPTVVSALTLGIQGGGYENKVTDLRGFYVSNIVRNQSLKLYVKSNTPITLYDIGFTVNRTYLES